MTSKDRDARPDIDVQVGNKRIKIDVSPIEWIILLLGASVLAFVLR